MIDKMCPANENQKNIWKKLIEEMFKSRENLIKFTDFGGGEDSFEAVIDNDNIDMVNLFKREKVERPCKNSYSDYHIATFSVKNATVEVFGGVGYRIACIALFIKKHQ
ncbi:MAG TPA: hypothetical protein VKF42_04350 [Chitinivibrionales bacterium]|jgi:hypothetical protein|nr:hypothetical protein [Chitinivibrionales bacterium]